MDNQTKLLLLIAKEALHLANRHGTGRIGGNSVQVEMQELMDSIEGAPSEPETTGEANG